MFPFRLRPFILPRRIIINVLSRLLWGFAGQGRIAYINGRKIEPAETNVAWDTWFLEDNQVKIWLVNSVSPEIQLLILRKRTARDMWVILEQLYGQKKKIVRVYQLMKDVYSLRQGDHSIADFYVSLKSKWEELDYCSYDTWDCPQDQRHLRKKRHLRTYQIKRSIYSLTQGDLSVAAYYAALKTKWEELDYHRRQVMHLTTGSVPSAFVSRASGTGQRPARRCTHCNKLGHSADYCWDLHPEKRLVRGRPPSGRRSPFLSDSSQGTPSSGVKTTKLSPDQLKELQAYIGRLSTTSEESSTMWSQ
ncbi:hypothetical protein EJ110_NYTH59116 [Nymphaea thermarum]|nr:hypothetical protein EJ110_NYTH59116 [Nymphaea thermarum]